MHVSALVERVRASRPTRPHPRSELWGQSFLSAAIGKTLAARRAGMIDAASDEIARIALAAPRVTGSHSGKCMRRCRAA